MSAETVTAWDHFQITEAQRKALVGWVESPGRCQDCRHCLMGVCTKWGFPTTGNSWCPAMEPQG